MRTLVIGGTGTVGSEVTSGLLTAGETVFIMSPEAAPRHPAGARVLRGDLGDAASMRAAMRGMDRVFLLLPQSPDERERGLAAARAARAEGVRRLVYMSVRMPSFAPEVPHFAAKAAIEGAVRDSGIPFTILRPNNFFQNDVALMGVMLRYGVYAQPIGAKGLSRVDVRDIAAAAVIALTQEGHEGETFEVNGPDLLTGESVAAIHARSLGREIRYAGDSLDDWAAGVRGVLPEWLVHDLRIMFAKFQAHGMPSTPRDDARLRRLLGRAPRTFDRFAAELARRALDGARAPALAAAPFGG